MLARTPRQRFAKQNAVKRRPDDLDRAVGIRIRARRIEQKLSQTELAGGCGVSFQQIQKYEKGTNRVGAGRLTRIAAALEIPAATLLGNEGAGETTLGDKLTATKFGCRLAQAALNIADKRKLAALVDIAESLAS